eukprot:200744_1
MEIKNISTGVWMDYDDEICTIKLVAVGDGAVGKTCLLIRYNTRQFPDVSVPTVFENTIIATELKINNENIVVYLDLWESDSYFDRLIPLVYRETDVFLICFSLECKLSLENIERRWIHEINHRCPDAIKILVGTKADLKEKLYDHELLVYGYINQLNFTNLNILNDIIDIILLFERGKQSLNDLNLININRHNENNPWPITMEDINDVKEHCKCMEYVETSALDGRNVQHLFDTAMKCFYLTLNEETKPCCQLL